MRGCVVGVQSPPTEQAGSRETPLIVLQSESHVSARKTSSRRSVSSAGDWLVRALLGPSDPTLLTYPCASGGSDFRGHFCSRESQLRRRPGDREL